MLPRGGVKAHKSWRGSGSVLSMCPWNSGGYWEKFLMNQRQNAEDKKGHVLLHHATGSQLGNKMYVQFLSDQENIYTKGDVNKYSSEVWKCMILLHVCNNSSSTFCHISILMFSAKFQSLYYFNRLLFLKL